MKNTRELAQHTEDEDTLRIEWDESYVADPLRPVAELTVRRWRSQLTLAVRTQSGFVNLPLDADACRHLVEMFGRHVEPGKD